MIFGKTFGLRAFGRVLQTLLLTAMLASCGAGFPVYIPPFPDDDPPGAYPSEPLGDPNEPLAFTTSLVAPALQSVAGVMERLQILGEAATVMVSQSALAGRSVTDAWCQPPQPGIAPQSGKYNLAWNDTDGSGTASPGDTVTAVFDDCAWPGMLDRLDGRLVLELAGSVPSASNLDLRVHFDETFRSGAKAMLGTLTSRVRREAFGTTYEVDVHPADELFLAFGGPVAGGVDQARLSRVINYETAQITSNVEMILRSSRSGGMLTARSSNPVVSRINRFPLRGEIEIIGNGDHVLVARLQEDERTEVTLTETGGEQRDLYKSMHQKGSAISRYWWWDSSIAGSTPLNGVSHDDGSMSLLRISELNDVRVFPEISMQFSDPVVSPDTLAVYFVPFDISDGFDPALAVPARLEVTGAHLLVRADQQLDFLTRYALHAIREQAIDGSDPFADFGWNAIRIYTRNNLLAVAEPSTGLVLAGETFDLSAGNSESTDGDAIVSYEWRQVSGPAAVIATPGESTTAVSPSAGGNPTGHALEFELTVTNSAGELRRTTTAVHSVPAPQQVSLGYLATDVCGGIAGAPAWENFLTDQSSTLDVRAWGTAGQVIQFDSTDGDWLTFSVASGNESEPLAIGHYVVTGSLTDPRFYFGFSGSSCPSYNGWFEIFEIEYEANGAVSRLALDYSFDGGDTASVVGSYGSIRINSARPLLRR